MRNWSKTTSRFHFEQKATKETKIHRTESFVSFVAFCSTPLGQNGALFLTMS